MKQKQQNNYKQLSAKFFLAQSFSFPFDSTFSGKQFFHLYHLSYQSQLQFKIK